jgi:CRISPR/Cas system-associated exonuclease Cas4 (RecB family)
MADYVKRYNPDRSSDWNFGGPKWKLSRSKIDLFIECPRCFYLDNKLGTARPRGPAFTLNVAVDTLFKKEFDVHREKQTAHPLMEKYGVDAVPYQHEDLNDWRENFVGMQFEHAATGFAISGAIDDVWKGGDGKLIVVDYKATSKEGTIVDLSDSSWEDQYRRQIGVYQWLLTQKGFDVSNVGYFVYANAKSDKKAFDATLEFEVTLVPCDGETKWIEPTLHKIRECLMGDVIPPTGERCEFCPYREAAGKKLQKLYKLKK